MTADLEIRPPHQPGTCRLGQAQSNGSRLSERCVSEMGFFLSFVISRKAQEPHQPSRQNPHCTYTTVRGIDASNEMESRGRLCCSALAWFLSQHVQEKEPIYDCVLFWARRVILADPVAWAKNENLRVKFRPASRSVSQTTPSYSEVPGYHPIQMVTRRESI